MQFKKLYMPHIWHQVKEEAFKMKTTIELSVWMEEEQIFIWVLSELQQYSKIYKITKVYKFNHSLYFYIYVCF